MFFWNTNFVLKQKKSFIIDFGNRILNKMNFSKTICLPKQALKNLDLDEGDSLKVELVQDEDEKFLKLTPVIVTDDEEDEEEEDDEEEDEDEEDEEWFLNLLFLGVMKLIKGITDFCPVCHDKLRTHNAKRYVECIEKLIEKGSHETSFKIASHERNWLS